MQSLHVCLAHETHCEGLKIECKAAEPSAVLSGGSFFGEKGDESDATRGDLLVLATMELQIQPFHHCNGRSIGPSLLHPPDRYSTGYCGRNSCRSRKGFGVSSPAPGASVRDHASKHERTMRLQERSRPRCVGNGAMWRVKGVWLLGDDPGGHFSHSEGMGSRRRGSQLQVSSVLAADA